MMIVSTITFLGLAEGVARLKYHPGRSDAANIFEYDPEKSFRLKSGYVGVYAGKEVRTDSYGFRGDPFDAAKVPGEWRIGLLGDSVTFGHGVEIEDTFGSQYRASLTRQFPDKKITVINAGVPGYSSMQEYHDLVRLLPLAPDVLIIQFAPNDVTEPYAYRLDLGGVGIDYHGVPDMSSFRYALSRRSALYLMAMDIVRWIRFGTTDIESIQAQARKADELTVSDLVSKPDHPQQAVRWSEYFLWLGKIADVCGKENIPCYILISPYAFQIGAGDGNDYPQQQVRSFAESRGIVSIDMLGVFRGYVKNTIVARHGIPEDTAYDFVARRYPEEVTAIVKTLFIDNDHYTPAGHASVSAQLRMVLPEPK